MKLFIILLAVLAVGFSIQGKTHGHCKELNPFLTRLSKDVEIYESPTMGGSPHCKPEWDKYGTCCEARSLIEYVETDNHKIRGSLRDVNTEFGQFYSFLTELNQTLFTMSTLKYFDWSPLIKTEFTAKKIRKFIKVLNGKFLNNSIFYTYNEPNMVEKFASANKKCWDRMVQLRNAAVCSTCSGRSRVFFMKQKANMDQATCSSIMNDCYISFKMANRYFKTLAGFSLVSDIKEILEGSLIKFKHLSMINKKVARKFVKMMGKEKMRYFTLDRYFKNKRNLTSEELKEKDRLARVLCKRFLSIQGYPWIRYLDSVIKRSNHQSMHIELTELGQQLIDAATIELGEDWIKETVEKRSSARWKKLYQSTQKTSSKPTNVQNSDKDDQKIDHSLPEKVIRQNSEKKERVLLKRRVSNFDSASRKLNNREEDKRRWRHRGEYHVSEADVHADDRAASSEPASDSSDTPTSFETDVNVIPESLISKDHNEEAEIGESIIRRNTCIKSMNLTMSFP